jgi:hypothetical protein
MKAGELIRWSAPIIECPIPVDLAASLLKTPKWNPRAKFEAASGYRTQDIGNGVPARRVHGARDSRECTC